MVYKKAGNVSSFKFVEFQFQFRIFVVSTILERNVSNCGYSKLWVTQPGTKWRFFDLSLHDTTVFWAVTERHLALFVITIGCELYILQVQCLLDVTDLSIFQMQLNGTVCNLNIKVS